MGYLWAAVELFHALAMAAWVVGLPLLFWHRWPRATRWYAVYAIVFVVLSQASHRVLGECFLTTLARDVFEQSAPATRSGELDDWFTVRLARRIFGMAPSHRAVVLASEIGMVITAAGVLFMLHVRRLAARGGAVARSERPRLDRWRAPLHRDATAGR